MATIDPQKASEANMLLSFLLLACATAPPPIAPTTCDDGAPLSCPGALHSVCKDRLLGLFVALPEGGYVAGNVKVEKAGKVICSEVTDQQTKAPKDAGLCVRVSAASQELAYYAGDPQFEYEEDAKATLIQRILGALAQPEDPSVRLVPRCAELGSSQCTRFSIPAADP